MRVLLVDDEEELVTAIAERLELRGFDAVWATNGSKALELVRTSHFDVVVLDAKMPGMTGLELMGMLADEVPELKFIFLTGHGSEEEYKACSAAGACSYLIKPAKLDALIEKIEEAGR